MQTTFNYEGSNLFTPTVFREDFNHFAPISATQAWALFFTASKDDAALGSNPAAGQFWNSILFAVVAAGILGVFVFRSSF
jgi:hypothetical protein